MDTRTRQELQNVGLAARNTIQLATNLGTSVTDILAKLEALLETVLVVTEKAEGPEVPRLFQQARDLAAAAERLRDLNRASSITTASLQSALVQLGVAPDPEDDEVTLVHWNPELSVLVESMDEQHKVLITHLNRLYAAIVDGGHNLGVRQTIAALQEYTLKHFRDEEALMEQHGFPDCALQKAQHAAFSSRVAEFAQKLDDGATLDAEAVLNFLKDWLLNHIQKCDRCYGEYFRDKNIPV